MKNLEKRIADLEDRVGNLAKPFIVRFCDTPEDHAALEAECKATGRQGVAIVAKDCSRAGGEL
ncbi:MAG: hypothetical protein A2075_23360 [Geobacteraceae bacterium GWC2_58_44]|nr:MAG: hypothetical protein A2075_23360 [Geobacteraceae bacterium GWC2_58_44]